MIVYRIEKAKYAGDLTGEGARLNGGRWNQKGFPCLYASESRALALLEYSVNVNIDDIPRALSLISFEIPISGIRVLKESDLPGNWKLFPAPASTKIFGTHLLKSQKNLVYKIPSIIIPYESNFLLNPSYSRSKRYQIVDIRDFVYDTRIKFA